MAIYFISSCLTLDFNKKLLIWLFASLTPIALLISYSGMETSLLIFLISLIIYGFWGKGSPSISYFAIALLPWNWHLTQQSLEFILITARWIQSKKIPFSSFLCLFIGIASFFLFNKLYFGSISQPDDYRKAEYLSALAYFSIYNRNS